MPRAPSPRRSLGRRTSGGRGGLTGGTNELSEEEDEEEECSDSISAIVCFMCVLPHTALHPRTTVLLEPVSVFDFF